METNEITKALEEIYKELYRNGGCKYDHHCEDGLCNNYVCRYYKAKLGSHYGEDGLPKLLFIGKEPPTEDECDLSRIPIEEPARISCVPRNNYHYFGTVYTAARILKQERPLSPNRDDLLCFENLRHFFCLTNYFKCVFKKSDKNSGVIVSKAMKGNCFNILTKEIETLQPDIIVVQGKFTGKGFWNALKEMNESIRSKSIVSMNNGVSAYQYHYANGSPLFVICSYHPCARGRKWYKSLKELDNAIDKVCSVWNKSCSIN